MPRSVRVVIVCEDILQETFMRAFLYRRGFLRRQLTFRKPEAGHGDAKQHVCELVSRELKAIRRFGDRGLIYVVDADRLSVDERRRAVEQACSSAGIDPPQAEEPVFGVIPKWEIENWLAYLRGETVDEESNRYDKYHRCESAIYPLVERLADMCDQQDLPNPPASLAATCADYPRFREWIRKR